MTAGTIIGRYELLRLLATGGMGEVYLARQQSSVEGFGALVAIKLLAKHLSANQAFVQMFLDEARIVGRLHHKNIVQVRDIATQNGQYFMVMEYIPGQNLRELLGDVSIPDRPLFEPRLGAELFVDMASALAAAHAEGLVHRDISPNNIMISDEGVPKLIDFGVARALSSASLTTPGTLKGKFGYMAPEYVRAHAYDHRVDLFSLGVVMWETFARRRLFRGTSAAEQLHQLLEGEIQTLDQVVPGFPPELAAIVAGALERDPNYRIATALELQERLAQVARVLPVARDVSIRRWLERRIPGRLEDRRQTDSTLLALPPGSPIPDFGVASPDAGSLPGTYGYTTAPRDAVSQRMSAQIPIAPPPSEIAPPAGPAHIPTTNRARITIFALATIIVALVVWMLARPGQDTDRRAAVTENDASAPSEDPKLVAAHREIGLAAMAEGDYARAVVEYKEAVRHGGGGDLPRLLEAAEKLAIQARDTEPAPAATPPPAPPSTKPESPSTEPAQVAESPRPIGPTPSIVITKAPPRAPKKPAPAPPPAKTPTRIATIETSQPEPVVAPPTTGTLAIVVRDNAAVAVVKIDGDVKGQTPLGLELPAGDHKLEVTIDARVVRSGPLSISAGKRTELVVDVPATRKEPATTAVIPVAPPNPTKAPVVLPPATVRVSSDGSATAGAKVVSACNACHKRSGVGTFSGRLYARKQWETFFASGQHDRYVRIGDRFGASEMSAARAYLRANAADSAENQGAGVRD